LKEFAGQEVGFFITPAGEAEPTHIEKQVEEALREAGWPVQKVSRKFQSV
jgi:type I site-specific restriction endonuclease